MAKPVTGPCPSCGSTGHANTVREEGQDGRTRCGSCLEATPNRRWDDFAVQLSPLEANAQAAKQLALVGMACLTAGEVEQLTGLAQVAAGGDEGAVTHAFAAIVSGYALKKYEGSRAVRKAVNGAISTMRQMRAKDGSVPVQ